MFKDFYKKGTFDEDENFKKYKKKLSDIEDDKFYQEYKQKRIQQSHPGQDVFEKTTTGNYSKKIQEEVVTKDGVTKKIVRVTIKYPDGRVENSVKEEIIGGSNQMNEKAEENQAEKKECSQTKNEPMKEKCEGTKSNYFENLKDQVDDMKDQEVLDINQKVELITENEKTKKVITKTITLPDGSKK